MGGSGGLQLHIPQNTAPCSSPQPRQQMFLSDCQVQLCQSSFPAQLLLRGFPNRRGHNFQLRQRAQSLVVLRWHPPPSLNPPSHLPTSQAAAETNPGSAAPALGGAQLGAPKPSQTKCLHKDPFAY